MNFEWIITEDDIHRVTQLVAQQSENPFVAARRERNLAACKPAVERQNFWREMVGMRLTSRQRSGPDSPVSQFLRTVPFPLSYDVLHVQEDTQTHIATTLEAAGGIRFTRKIPQELSKNLLRLENGDWDRALQECNRLRRATTKTVERDVARYIDTYKGFGPKQSRNLLQALGLTRYEIPIDSRIANETSVIPRP